MATDIKVSAELMGYTLDEQMTILKHVDRETPAPSKRMQETVDKIIKIIDDAPLQDTFEGYGGFPIEKTLIDKNKRQLPDDRTSVELSHLVDNQWLSLVVSLMVVILW